MPTPVEVYYPDLLDESDPTVVAPAEEEKAKLPTDGGMELEKQAQQQQQQHTQQQQHYLSHPHVTHAQAYHPVYPHQYALQQATTPQTIYMNGTTSMHRPQSGIVVGSYSNVYAPNYAATVSSQQQQLLQQQQQQQQQPSTMPLVSPPHDIPTTNAKPQVYYFPKEMRKMTKKEREAKEFEEYYNELVRYKKTYNLDEILHIKNNPDFSNLHHWVKTVRNSYQAMSKRVIEGKHKPRRQGKLTPERIAKLKEIGFVLNKSVKRRGQKVDDSDDHFEEWFALLEEFKMKYGHCNVPTRQEAGEDNTDLPLARWCVSLRERYKKKKEMEAMDKDRPFMIRNHAMRLDQIGFDWEWVEPSSKWERRPPEKTFTQYFNELVAYKARHNLDQIETITNDGTPEGASLHAWSKKVRKSYGAMAESTKEGTAVPRRMGYLNVDKIRMLEEIGFLFETPTSTNQDDAVAKSAGSSPASSSNSPHSARGDLIVQEDFSNHSTSSSTSRALHFNQTCDMPPPPERKRKRAKVRNRRAIHSNSFYDCFAETVGECDEDESAVTSILW